EYIQDLLSQETKRPASLEDALDEMANLYLEKKDPVRKAERAQKRKSAGRQKVVTGRSHSKSPQRKKLSAETKHALNLRDGRQCTEMGPSGQRCENRRWLDYHHIIPISAGGADELENLVTLCRGHHEARHLEFRR
ncbi:MAG: HNH endonuclease, partial [Pseudobdellovibrionaceae bacterium]